ncbi:hypothetical protein H5410_006324 [Solanum commersonii]|uniref:Uncharacterized protein n=1 Tax=Solanum commersonii TaxID=4109 RepID=A0A9J6AA40_SOLCO|nr:hypothetical protein H5410_006324 [Solanum commersonii]
MVLLAWSSFGSCFHGVWGSFGCCFESVRALGCGSVVSRMILGDGGSMGLGSGIWCEEEGELPGWRYLFGVIWWWRFAEKKKMNGVLGCLIGDIGTSLSSDFKLLSLEGESDVDLSWCSSESTDSKRQGDLLVRRRGWRREAVPGGSPVVCRFRVTDFVQVSLARRMVAATIFTGGF